MAWLGDVSLPDPPQQLPKFVGNLDILSSFDDTTICFDGAAADTAGGSLDFARGKVEIEGDYFKDIYSGDSSHDVTSFLDEGNDSHDEDLWANQVSCLPDIVELGSADDSRYSKMDSDIISVMGSSDDDLEIRFSGFSMAPISAAALNASERSESVADVFGEVRSKHALGAGLANPNVSAYKPGLLIIPDLDDLVSCGLPHDPHNRRSHTGGIPAVPVRPPALTCNTGLAHSLHSAQAPPRIPRSKIVHNSLRAQSSVTKLSAGNRQRARQLGAATPRRRSSTGSVSVLPYQHAGAHTCHACGTTNTPLWRGGPNGPKTLCNACGVRWMKSKPTKRPQEKRV